MSRPRKQKRSHQTTSSHKKASARSRAIRLEIAPEQLIEKGNIQEAVRVLREQVQTAPSDEKRRLLGECLFDLKRYQEAAAAWLTLQEKTAGDLQSVGVAFLSAKDWEQARQFLDESVQRVENAYTYYLLALTHLRGELWYSVDIETNQKVLNLLQRARALPGCPPRGYLLLDHVLWSLACKKTEGEDEEVQDQARAQSREQCGEVLEEAFRLYPDHDQIRLEFAKSLVLRKQYEAALIVLVSLVNRAERSEETVALAVYASIEAGLFEQAQHYLDLLPPPPSDEKRFSVGLDKLRGDLFLQQAKFKEALECYENERQRGVFVARFIGTFSCAWVCLLQGQREQSIAYAEEGATLWFEQDDLLDRFYAFDEEPICIGMHHIGDESPALCVKQVCERLLVAGALPDQPLKGQLSYLLYQYDATYYERRSPDLWQQKTEHEQLLLQAAQLYPHPDISEDLSRLFLKMGDVPRAIEHHLTYCIHLLAHEPEDFEDEYAEFAYEKVTIATEEERRRTHKAALGLLQACHDASVVQGVFLPFFTSFWLLLLQAGQMFHEIVNVTQIFMDALPQVNTVWFYHACALSGLGKNDEAERVYRLLLKQTPGNSSALHNLALLLEKKGLLQDALALSDKAVALVPNNELIVSGNNRFKRVYEEREQARQQQDQLRTSSQERAQLWSLLSDSQKRLLCLLELYPVAHWSALHPHVKNDEQQLRQLQEDWDLLLAHGVYSQTGAGTPVRAILLLQPCVLEEGFRCWLSAEIARVQVRRKKDLWLPGSADLEDEQLTGLSSAQRDLLHQALMRQVERVALSGLEQFHLRFYRRIWKQLLIEWKMYDALVDLCEQFLSRLSVMTREELWECAYYATDLSGWPYRNIAEKRYQEYLAQEKSYAAYHNLSLIYLREYKYHEALQMIEQALQLHPSNEKSINQKARIEQAIQKEEEKQAQIELQRQREKERREQRFKDLEPKIQDHLAEVDYYKQNILRTVETATFYSKRSFAKRVGMEEWALNGHWRKLVAWGMIIEEDRQPIVHPLISTYLEQGWPIISGSSVKPKEPKVAEASSVVVNVVKELFMGDQIRNQIGDISNISGQLFIGKFNNVIASLKSNGQTELAEALKTLEQAVMASGVLLVDEKQEQVEIINHIGEEAAKPKPNKTLLKALGDGLVTTLRSVPDVAKAVTSVAPILSQWHH